MPTKWAIVDNKMVNGLVPIYRGIGQESSRVHPGKAAFDFGNERRRDGHGAVTNRPDTPPAQANHFAADRKDGRRPEAPSDERGI